MRSCLSTSVPKGSPLRRACGAALCLIVLPLAAIWGCAPTPEIPPPPAPVVPRGDGVIEGRIYLPGNKTVSGPVVIKANGIAAESGPSGEYLLDGLPGGKIYLVAELRNSGERYLAVETIRLREGERTSVDMQLGDAANVDAFCSDCHPFRGEKTRRDQIIRDLHMSDIKPVQATKNLGTLDERGFVTCESCHTIHEETGVRHFVRWTYEDGKLCLRCH